MLHIEYGAASAVAVARELHGNAQMQSGVFSVVHRVRTYGCVRQKQKADCGTITVKAALPRPNRFLSCL